MLNNITLTTMNNVGSTTLLHPVFINFEQVIIFRRVIELVENSKIECTMLGPVVSKAFSLNGG